MKETLFLTKNRSEEVYYFKDASGFCLARMNSIELAKDFVRDNNYRLRIEIGSKREWFNQ